MLRSGDKALEGKVCCLDRAGEGGAGEGGGGEVGEGGGGEVGEGGGEEGGGACS